MPNDRTREAPAERFDAPSLLFDLRAEAQALRNEPSQALHGHRQKTLYKHHGATVALFVMDQGAALPEHAVNGAVAIQAIEGEITTSTHAETHHLHPGHLLTLPPNAPHNVRALTPAVFVLFVALEGEGGR